MAQAPRSLIAGIIARILPQYFADDRDVDKPVRLRRYGEIALDFVPDSLNACFEEGSYLVATSDTLNPVAVASCTFVAAQTAYSDTAPNFLIINNEPAGGKTIYLDFLKMLATAAGTAATQWNYVVVTDPTMRAPTTQHMTPATLCQPNTALGVNYKAPIVYYQSSATATVIPASSAQSAIAAHGQLGGLNLAGDEFFIQFGVKGQGYMAAAAAVASPVQPGRRCSCEGPVGVAPGGSAAIHIFGASSSAAFNPSFTMGLLVR